MMGWLLVLSLMSAPIIKEERYDVVVKSCSDGQMIVATQQSTYAISLFNVALSKDGATYVCSRVLESSEVSIEVDRYATIVDHISAWVFVGEDLLQKELVEQGYAKIIIHNPEYSYDDLMKEASIQANASVESNASNAREFDRERGKEFLFFNFLGLFLMVVLVLVIHHIKKRRIL